MYSVFRHTILFLIIGISIGIPIYINNKNLDCNNYCNDTVNSLANNNTCTTCKMIVDIIKYEFDIANKSIAIIMNVVEDICQRIPGPRGKECYIIADKIKEIIDELAKGFNTTHICEGLGFCDY